MNRRGFLGLLGLGAAAVAAPELLLPKRTIFLPPRGGWARDPLTMRESLQYVVSDDEMVLRFDVLWADATGERRVQTVAHMSAVNSSLLHDDQWMQDVREEAARIMRRMRPEGGAPVPMELPPGLTHSRIITL